MKKKIIITGATGFIGFNLVKYLLNEEFDICVIIRESSKNNLDELNKMPIKVFQYDFNLDSLINFLKSEKPDCICHLASFFTAEHRYNQIDNLLDSNIKFGLHLLEAMKESGIRMMVNVGTSWQHYKNEEYNPVCLYAATKQSFEALIDYYVQAENFHVITLKLFDTYGENDTRSKILNLLSQHAESQQTLNMSPGLQYLNLVHISDVCKAFKKSFELLSNEMLPIHQKYAVSTNENHNIKEVVSIFEEVINKKININWGGRNYRTREVLELWNGGHRLPNWKAEISLKDGLITVFKNK